MTAPLPVSQPWGFGSGAGGPVVVPPQNAASLSPVGRVLQLPLPEVFMIPDGHAFNTVGQATSVGAEANTVILGTVVTIPDSNYAVISSVSLYITNMNPATNVLWTVTVDGNSVQGFQNLSIFPRTSPFVGNTFDQPVRLTGACTVQVIFSNLDGGGYTIGAALSGWFWPVTSDQRWKTGG